MTIPTSSILSTKPLGMHWPTLDPFLFCAHHNDRYPAGNAAMGPNASLEGRQLGQDFSVKDGWSMYHGQTIPGFPSHPHRGFETVTLVRTGLIDHSDSLGATARFGGGDVQWLTAGAGIVHCEMFPLVKQDAPNPLELFQIWLNLPAKSKMVPPHFTMLWAESIPRETITDDRGATTEVVYVSGAPATVAGSKPPPPPDSWAANPQAGVAIWTIKLSPGARWTLPKATQSSATRMLYFFAGDTLRIGDDTSATPAALQLDAQHDLVLQAGGETCECLLLQGVPISEPVAQYGPFVMNTQAEIHQTFADYRRTQFGGWPWPSDGPVHPREQGRFAKHLSGKVETR